MNKNWVYFDPADQSTAAMLEYILVACAQVRGMAERHRFPVPDEDKPAVVSAFLKQHPEAKPVPRYTLLAAVNWPSRQVDSFILSPREGWSNIKEKTGDSVSWEEYNKGESANKKTDARAVNPEDASKEFLSDKKLRFRWGTLVMHTGYLGKLKLQAGSLNGSFLSKVKWMEVRVVRSRDGERRWKIRFSLR